MIEIVVLDENVTRERHLRIIMGERGGRGEKGGRGGRREGAGGVCEREIPLVAATPSWLQSCVPRSSRTRR